MERLSYLFEWANSAEYQQIKQGNYLRVGQRGSVDVEAEDNQAEVDNLKRQIEELQQEIERIKNQRREQ